MTDLTAPGPLVEVEWSDSAGRSDWHDPEDARRSLDQMDCISAGYLAEDDERGVLLVMGSGAMGSWLNSMAIPRHAIKKVRVVTDPLAEKATPTQQARHQ